MFPYPGKIYLDSYTKERSTTREIYEKIIKEEFRRSLIKARNSSGMTQEQMAQKLDMSVRAYCGLESGENGCGVVTLVIFLNHICKDPLNFLTVVQESFELRDSGDTELVS